MWSFLEKKRQSPTLAGSKDLGVNERPRPMKFSQIVEGMGDFCDLATNDDAMKFWLPEPAMEALRELCAISGNSISESLRQFFAHHCYGIYAFHVMLTKHPDLFKDPEPPKFSRRFVEPPPGKKRIYTYWVPELGKNVVAMKVWVPSRLRNDLQILAAHVELNLSQYAREIVISRLLGHGTLPYRPEMLRASPLPAAQDWCENHAVEMRQVEEDDFHRYAEGERRSEFVDV
jgi:hypothetical protein